MIRINIFVALWYEIRYRVIFSQSFRDRDVSHLFVVQRVKGRYVITYTHVKNNFWLTTRRYQFKVKTMEDVIISINDIFNVFHSKLNEQYVRHYITPF